MSRTTPHILAVCTGNICRSPAIERMVSRRLGDAVVIGSAGTSAVVGAPVAPLMRALMDQAGVPSSGFAARQIDERTIEWADLILTATGNHRARVVEMAPKALNRTFTLLEFAEAIKDVDRQRLAAAGPRERIAILAKHARQARPRLRLGPDDIDIVDPYGQPEEVYQEAFGLIEQAVSVVADVLSVEPPPPVPRRALDWQGWVSDDTWDDRPAPRPARALT